MANCFQQIEKIASDYNLTVTRVDKTLADTLRHSLKAYLQQRRDRTLCLVRRADGWLWLADYVGESSVILFFMERDTDIMFYVNGGDTVDFILGDIGGCTPSYITDETGSFLFEWSHEYDQLVAYKGAIDWLKEHALDRGESIECYEAK